MTRSEQMRQLIETPKTGEPVAWYRVENGIRVYYETEAWPDLMPLYSAPSDLLAELKLVKVERGELALKLAGAECFIEEQRKNDDKQCYYPRDNALELARSKDVLALAWKAGFGNETLKHPDQALLARSFLAIAAELEYRESVSTAGDHA